jgi:HSP20 family protein
MMRLVRWTPRETARRDAAYPFGPWLDELWRTAQLSSFATPKTLRPAMDVIENDSEIVIRVDLPGMPADALDVQVEGDLLTISGEVKNEAEQEGERYHYRERSYGAFKRSLRLGEQVDSQHIEATFENGVLHLRLPKLPEAQPKQIKVKTA